MPCTCAKKDPDMVWTNKWWKTKTVNYEYIVYNTEWEAVHSWIKVWKILEGTKGNNYYGSTFVCLDMYHLIRERIMETKATLLEEK